MPRKAGNTNSNKKPALHFDAPVKKTKLNVEIASHIADLAKGYPGFIEATTGAKPSVDEVIEKCVLKVLGGDKAYRDHLGNQNSNRQQSGAETSRTTSPQ